MTGETSPNGSPNGGIDQSIIEELEARSEVAAGHMRNANKLYFQAVRRRTYAGWLEAVLFTGRLDHEGIRSEIHIAALGGAEVTTQAGELRGIYDFAQVYVAHQHDVADEQEDRAEAHSRSIST